MRYIEVEIHINPYQGLKLTNNLWTLQEILVEIHINPYQGLKLFIN